MGTRVSRISKSELNVNRYIVNFNDSNHSFHNGKIVQKTVPVLETDGSSLQQTLGQPGFRQWSRRLTWPGSLMLDELF